MRLLLLSLTACFSALALDIRLFDENDKPIPQKNAPKLEVLESTDNAGIKTFKCTLTSLTDARQFVRITAIDTPFKAKAITVYDGADALPAKGKPIRRDLLREMAFTMAAVWNTADASKGAADRTARAIALGAEDMNSFADMAAIPQKDAVQLQVAVNAALLHKGARYRCTFHVIPFSPKYGIRDALARYYRLYPERFTRNPSVNQAVYGINAGYKSWFHADPELCRFANASWEWCYAANRSWGDDLNACNPTPTPDFVCIERQNYKTRQGKIVSNTNTKLTREQFDNVIDTKLSNGYYCGIVNGFYTMSISCISNIFAEKYPDSVISHHGNPSGYIMGTDVFTFPEVSWGQQLRKNLAELAKRRDIGIIAFDVSMSRSIYRGPALGKMENVSFDKYGEGIVRGVANAKLADFVRTLKCKKQTANMAAAFNCNKGHIDDILYADNIMIEREPWAENPPFPMQFRFFVGEKGLQLWEGYNPKELKADFPTWPQEDKDQLIRDLARYAVHRSLATGASLPAHYLTEYVSAMSFAFVDCNDAGWKPVLGAKASKDIELARYGLGINSLLTLNNLKNTPVTPKIELFPAELHFGIVTQKQGCPAILFAPYFGGKAENVLSKDGRQQVTCSIPPLMSNVLEAVATADGVGAIQAQWSGSFDNITLTLTSSDFAGTVSPRRNVSTYHRTGQDSFKLTPGQTVTCNFQNSILHGPIRNLRDFAFFKENNKPDFHIEFSPDSDSDDIAQRIAQFFIQCAQKTFKPKTNLTKSLRLVKNPKLPKLTVAIVQDKAPALSDDVSFGIVLNPTALSLHAIGRDDLDALARRFLNALNAERFPDYLPDVHMPQEEKAFFTFRRF